MCIMKKDTIRSNERKILSIVGTTIVFILIFFVSISIYHIHETYTSIDGIKGEEFIGKKKSPDGRYEVEAFRNNGGATTDYAILVVLSDLEKGAKKNIFWDYHCDEAEMKWHSNDTVEINGIFLKVPNDVYDYRKNKEQS